MESNAVSALQELVACKGGAKFYVLVFPTRLSLQRALSAYETLIKRTGSFPMHTLSHSLSGTYLGLFIIKSSLCLLGDLGHGLSPLWVSPPSLFWE